MESFLPKAFTIRGFRHFGLVSAVKKACRFMKNRRVCFVFTFFGKKSWLETSSSNKILDRICRLKRLDTIHIRNPFSGSGVSFMMVVNEVEVYTAEMLVCVCRNVCIMWMCELE